jgi:peptide/nickel transport system permease protein
VSSTEELGFRCTPNDLYFKEKVSAMVKATSSFNVWVFRKLLQTALTLFLVIVLNFFLIRLMPGDVLVGILGESEYSRLMVEFPEELDRIREEYGLNASIDIQFVRYMTSIVQLDFGYSFITKQPVIPYVLYHMQWTLILLLPVILISALIGGIMGAKAGWKSGGRLDKLMTPVAIVLSNIPAHFVAILFLMLFAFRLRWFPLGSMTSGGLSGIRKVVDVIRHMSLPVLILVLFRSMGNFLYMKSYTMQIANQEFVTTALSKGLTDKQVLKRHVLKNILPPYFTLLCMQFGHIFSGSMVMETVFSWRGMGALLQISAKGKDYPVLQFSILIIAASVLFFNLLADFLNILIDPRIREGVHR